HDGGDLRGEDRLVPRDAATTHRRFAIRFHLHPSIRVTRMADGKSLVLLLPSGTTWRFGCDAQIDHTDTVYLGTGESGRTTHQIVVSGTTAGESVAVKWALKKIAGAPAVN